MSASALAAALPLPRYTATVEDATAEEDGDQQRRQQQVALQATIPPYGRRRGWKPKEQSDFGDGGAYPECHIAQYPLDMGRKKAVSGNHSH
jgi:SNW domain-containing protein 1